MRALKLLVIAMGVLILAATVVLVTIVVNRAGQLGGDATQAERTVSVPQGFHVTATDISGDRLLVRLEGHEPGEAGDEVRLMVFDLAHGASIRTVRLVPSGTPSPPEAR